MKNLVMMIFLITSINNSFADSIKLEKGNEAPFTGFLIEKDRVEELVKAEKQNIVLKDLRITQDEIIEYHKQDARVQRRKLSEAKFDTFLANAGYFVLGAVLTGLTFKLNQKIGDI